LGHTTISRGLVEQGGAGDGRRGRKNRPGARAAERHVHRVLRPGEEPGAATALRLRPGMATELRPGLGAEPEAGLALVMGKQKEGR